MRGKINCFFPIKKDQTLTYWLIIKNLVLFKYRIE